MKFERGLGRTLILCGAVGLMVSVASGQVVPESNPRSGTARGKLPDTWGTTNVSYYRLAATQFTPLASYVSYDDAYSKVNGVVFRRFATIVSGEFVGTPNLPSGALLTSIELDSCVTTDLFTVELRAFDCDYTGDCPDGAFLDTSSNGNAGPGCGYTIADVSNLGIVVDNVARQITVRIITGSGTEATSFSGVIFGYKLQVAPAPGTATFTDVPTSSPQFQFIEALAAAGVTAGCGGGQFCPNNPVTRGQMAVFLAKALGIYSKYY